MRAIQISYFVYGAGVNPKPLEPGVALYARAWVGENEIADFRWDPKICKWVESDYLWRLLTKGDVDLDYLEQSELPQDIPPPMSSDLD